MPEPVARAGAAVADGDAAAGHPVNAAHGVAAMSQSPPLPRQPEDVSGSQERAHNGGAETSGASAVVTSSPPQQQTSGAAFLSSSLSLQPSAFSRSQLPISPSFLQSLASLPPLSPNLSPVSPAPAAGEDALSLPASASTASASSSTSAAEDPAAYQPCPCQVDSDALSFHTHTPRRKAATSPSTQLTSPRTSLSSSSASASATSSVPASIANILQSISASLTAPPPSSFTPNAESREHIIHYLESLHHHLTHTLTTLIRYLQHARHAQLVAHSDPLLLRLSARQLQLVERLKTLSALEQAAKLRLAECEREVEGGRRAVLGLSGLKGLASVMQSEKRREEAVERAKKEREEERRKSEDVAEEKRRVEQQLLVVSGVVGEMRDVSSTGRAAERYELLLDGLRTGEMAAVLSKEEVEEAVRRVEVMREWRAQEEIGERKLRQVGRMQREMRERLDELVIVWYCR